MSGGEELHSVESPEESFVFNLQILKTKPSELDSAEEEEEYKLSQSRVLFSEKSFIKSPNLSEKDESLTRFRKRSYENKQIRSNNFYDKDIRLKEIIEDRLSGVPTKLEKKQREERIERLKRNRKGPKAQPEDKNQQGTNSKIADKSSTMTPKEEKVPIKKEEALHVADLFPKVVLKDGKPTIHQCKIEPPRKLIPETNENLKKLNSKSFKEQNAAAKWSPEETRKFYKAMEFFGSDFSMIAMVIKDRTREQLKNKFHKEEKLNFERVNAALLKHKKIDVMTMLEQNCSLQSKRKNKNAPENKVSSEKNSEGSLDDMDREIILELSKTLGDSEQFICDQKQE